MERHREAVSVCYVICMYFAYIKCVYLEKWEMNWLIEINVMWLKGNANSKTLTLIKSQNVFASCQALLFYTSGKLTKTSTHFLCLIAWSFFSFPGIIVPIFSHFYTLHRVLITRFVECLAFVKLEYLQQEKNLNFK